MGCGQETIHGLDWFENFIPPKYSADVKSVFKKLIAGEVELIEFYENPIINRQGEERMIAWHNAPLVDSSGKITGILTSGEDITEKIEMERQLRQSQKMQSIGTLAGGIAHDFNNILTAIIGYSELAQHDRENPATLEKDLSEILLAAERAKNLVRQILTFSRKAQHDKQPLQISLVVKEALKLLRSSIPTTIAITQDVVSDSLVLADPTNIHQIVMNLCTNAYHAMRESGGTLSVTLKDVELSGPESVSSLELPAGGYVKLEVSDTGIGMDEKTKAKIFEPYFTTKDVGEGTGLGLAVVHGAVRDHGGIIELSSEVGQGTSFHVYLPICQREDAGVFTKTEGSQPPVGGNETIMLVDDDVKISSFVQRSLQNQGYTVCVQANGVQALQEFQLQPLKFQLVITDMTMPFMTGTQLAQKLLEVKPDVPILLCTGYSELTNRKKTLAMGIKEYIEKPLDIDRLLRTVRKVLDVSKINDLKILFVDDMQFNVDLGTTVLGRLGCEVIGVTSGQEAIDVLTESPHSVDVVFTDQNMPNMTGFELSQKILEVRPDMPIFLITGTAHLDEKQVHSHGILEVIEKPLAEDTLINVLRRVVRK